ncbi:hypothetical protein ACFLWZ_02475 [Chloroflexota bacterium]
MNSDLPTYNSERETGLAWLRDVLNAMLEVSPVSYQQKKKTAPLLQRMPEWLMASWAQSLNIDYIGGCTSYPDMAEQAKSDTGRQLAQSYLEAHDAVPVGFCLDQLARSVIKRVQGGRLPVDADMVVRQVCALALAECTEDGIEFAEKAREILSEAENPNHPLVDYQIVLERGDKDKLEQLDSILTGSRYGEWVDSRLDEAKRYLGLDSPIFRISFVERTPQWDALWENIIKGGSND